MNITAGIGFKTDHLEDALAASRPGLWFEVHADNYMVDGGPRLAALDALAELFPVSLHAVGLSLASPEPPSGDYVQRLRRLAERIGAAAISDHLAWQKLSGIHHADFLPFPRTREAFAVVSGNVARVQDALGRQIMVENPSLYVDLPGHDMDEVEFLTELAAKTGCGLLLDVNNVFVSATNLGFSPEARIDAIPPSLIGEIHLAGHTVDADPASPLLIDSHDTPVAGQVWELFRRLIARIGPRPTLLERDGNVPAFGELMRERDEAHRFLAVPALAHV